MTSLFHFEHPLANFCIRAWFLLVQRSYLVEQISQIE